MARHRDTTAIEQTLTEAVKRARTVQERVKADKERRNSVEPSAIPTTVQIIQPQVGSVVKTER